MIVFFQQIFFSQTKSHTHHPIKSVFLHATCIVGTMMVYIPTTLKTPHHSEQRYMKVLKSCFQLEQLYTRQYNTFTNSIRSVSVRDENTTKVKWCRSGKRSTTFFFYIRNQSFRNFMCVYMFKGHRQSGTVVSILQRKYPRVKDLQCYLPVILQQLNILDLNN